MAALRTPSAVSAPGLPRSKSRTHAISHQQLMFVFVAVTRRIESPASDARAAVRCRATGKDWPSWSWRCMRMSEWRHRARDMQCASWHELSRLDFDKDSPQQQHHDNCSGGQSWNNVACVCITPKQRRISNPGKLCKGQSTVQQARDEVCSSLDSGVLLNHYVLQLGLLARGWSHSHQGRYTLALQPPRRSSHYQMAVQ